MNLMKAVQKITIPDRVKTDALIRLMALIGGDVDAPKSLLVGGCVRNALMGVSSTDIDIATQYSPQEITEILTKENIKVIPTGIDHGTVTAVVKGTSFEITTLRTDEDTDGRHATVRFTDDWLADARRRDFTINTLLSDMDGNVFDPTGKALEDLKSCRVVFVGEAGQRIEEDYLRILRFFRFHAQYGEGAADVDALNACRKAADKISSLSRERITQEFLKILATDKAVEVLDLMFAHNILLDFKSEAYQADHLKHVIALQNKNQALDVVTRLFILNGNKPKFHDDILRLSHAQKNFLVKLEMVKHPHFYSDKKSLKKAIYHHGNNLMTQGLLLSSALGQTDESPKTIELVQNWQAPKCPITGQQLLAEGYQTGPELGQELARRQEEWLEDII